VYPVGIDVSEFERASPEVDALSAQIRKDTADKKIVLGVDRLDYTKGVLRRLQAIDRLLEREPSLRSRLHFIQLAVPTREKVEAYGELRRSVNEMVGRINSQYGSPTYSPVQLLYRSVSADQLLALYRAADVMLVTPLRDGMNLVAKEYVAARTDGLGTLVLSEFAGAASELVAALLVNPYNVAGVAAVVRQAMFMSEVQQRARMATLRAVVRNQSVQKWAVDFLADLEAVSPASLRPPSGELDLQGAVEHLQRAEHRTLLLDYDGTLAPIAELPELAAPEPQLLELLKRLAGLPRTDVHIVTGRGRDSIEAWFDGLPVWMHTEHGFRSRRPDGTWLPGAAASPAMLESVIHIMTRHAERTNGTLVEPKQASVAFHYRRANPYAAQECLRLLRAELASALGDEGELLEGRKVLEVRLRGINKGGAARLALAHAPQGSQVLAVGDDRTDEDLFGALPPDAITIKVGTAPSAARLRVEGPREVRALLKRLLDSLSDSRPRGASAS
jgi:trehalose 6-phosphate synthase/phosphatase